MEKKIFKIRLIPEISGWSERKPYVKKIIAESEREALEKIQEDIDRWLSSEIYEYFDVILTLEPIIESVENIERIKEKLKKEVI